MTLDQYKDLIQRNYLIHSILEDRVRTVLNANQGDSLTYFFHSKLNWLEKDINHLSIKKPISLPTSILTPSFNNISDLYGCLYVVEGSMLGGRILYQALKQNKQLSSVPEFHFFKNYGNNAPLRWKTFKNIVEDEDQDPQATTRSAINTFPFMRPTAEMILDAASARFARNYPPRGNVAA